VSESDKPVGGNTIAVISEGYWARRFGRAPDVLGRTLTLDGRQVSIVGVERGGFNGFMPGMKFDVSLPLSMYVDRRKDYLTTMSGFESLAILARVGRGVPEAQALGAADVVFQQFMTEPAVSWARKNSPQSYSAARLLPAGKGRDELRHQYGVPLLILIGMAGLVLLVASANVANLLLARASARARETAIRLCVGSGRWRLVRQFLTESAVLALAGAALGVLLSIWGTDLIVALFGTWQRPLDLDAAPNIRVLSFTIALALFTGLTFGVLPALRMTKIDLTPSLKAGSEGLLGVRRGSILTRGLVIMQVALSVVALVTAALFAQSVSNLKGRRAGFDPSNVLLFDVSSYGLPLSADDLRALYADVLARVEGLPGVNAASLSSMTPLNPVGTYRGVVIQGQPETPDARGVFWNQVSESYFRTIGVRLMQGRTFEERDMRGDGRVAVLNARAARHIFKDANPVGQTIAWMSAPSVPVEVIGIVEDTSRDNLRDDPPRMVYSPLAAGTPYPGSVQVAIKSTAAPGPLVTAVRDLIRNTGRSVVVDRVRTMEDQINGSLVRERSLAWLSAGFAIVAAVLACVGLYGVMSYQVARQTREIGIRLAIGARPGVLLGRVIGGSMALAVAGIAIGLVTTWFATSLVETLVYGLTPNDPATLAGVSLILALTALGASYLPARRAARIDPLRALRTE
jgi:predicted permease